MATAFGARSAPRASAIARTAGSRNRIIPPGEMERELCAVFRRHYQSKLFRIQEMRNFLLRRECDALFKKP